MSVLSDKTIRRLATDLKKPMIQPFYGRSVKELKGERVASYGLSTGGYDIRAAPEFMIFKPIKYSLWERLKQLFTGKPKPVPPLSYKKITEDMFDVVLGSQVVVPPGGFLLARSMEYVDMPRDVLALCIGKSTIARAGWNCLCTPIEPGWDGYITLEFQNTTDRPNIFYAEEGCLQLVFQKLDEEPETSYADRAGKYNNQSPQIVLPRV
jgi:dCTP deaminase